MKRFFASNFLLFAILVSGSVLLAGATVLDLRAVADLAALRHGLASEGGGVLIVRNAEDCLATTGVVESLAAELDARGIAVRGAILKRGGEIARRALSVASQAFPHGLVSPRATIPLREMGYAHTPIALFVDGEGVAVATVPVAVADRFLPVLQDGNGR